MSEERGQYEIEPIESIEQIEQEIQEINERDNALDVGEQFGGFVSYHKELSDQADAHLYDGSTLVIYGSSRNRVTLDATEAWNLFAFLESQKDLLWSNMRGKPADISFLEMVWSNMRGKLADISFLEMEDQQGIYRIVGQDEMDRDVKRYLSDSEITVPDRCPYCKMNPCICEPEPEMLP